MNQLIFSISCTEIIPIICEVQITSVTTGSKLSQFEIINQIQIKRRCVICKLQEHLTFL